jgi:two-component system sensor histidine kinase/response regulator
MIMSLILTISIVMFSAGFFSYTYIKNYETNRLTNFANISADRLAKSLATPMWNLDSLQVDDLINTEMNEKTIDGIIVNDEGDKGRFSSRGRDDNGTLIPYFSSSSNSAIRVKRDVVRSSQNIGSIELFVTEKYLEEQLLKLGVGAAMIMLILFLAIILLMNILLSRIIISPLLQLVSVADAISAGELDQELDVQSEDEIGYLADSFSKMQVSFRLLMKRLSNSRKESVESSLDPTTEKEFIATIRDYGKMPSLASLFRYSRLHNVNINDLIRLAREEWKKQNPA